MQSREVYEGSDGALTKSYYAELEKCGPKGHIAVNLFRAQKCSARAKVYRGGIRGQGSYRGMAYGRKQWAMSLLVKTLMSSPALDGIRFGWKRDEAAQFGPEWVLYVDLPQGQVSFHSPVRGDGPNYPADWDGQHKSPERILAFCDSVMDVGTMTQLGLLEPAGGADETPGSNKS